MSFPVIVNLLDIEPSYFTDQTLLNFVFKKVAFWSNSLNTPLTWYWCLKLTEETFLPKNIFTIVELQLPLWNDVGSLVKKSYYFNLIRDFNSTYLWISNQFPIVQSGTKFSFGETVTGHPDLTGLWFKIALAPKYESARKITSTLIIFLLQLSLSSLL